MGNRYKVTVEYNGTPFFGWQRQEGLDTVQQRLEESVVPLTKESIVFYGSGRTDTGVHAMGQVAHFDIQKDFDCFRLRECMNAHLWSVPIRVLSVEKVPCDFDARFSAVERFYRYKIFNRRVESCLHIDLVGHVMYRLDEEKMNSAAKWLVGKHDFSSFRAAGCQSRSPLKTLNQISVKREGDLIIVETSARSFLYRQVRNMVGSLIQVGCGRWSEQYFCDIFDAKDRTRAGPTASACGLYLVEIRYGLPHLHSNIV